MATKTRARRPGVAAAAGCHHRHEEQVIDHYLAEFQRQGDGLAGVSLAQLRQRDGSSNSEHAGSDRPSLKCRRSELGKDPGEGDSQATNDYHQENRGPVQVRDDLRRAQEQDAGEHQEQPEGHGGCPAPVDRSSRSGHPVSRRWRQGDHAFTTRPGAATAPLVAFRVSITSGACCRMNVQSYAE